MTKQNAYLILKSMTPDDLRTWREKHGYTQVQLAQALGVHEMTVSKWERGVTRKDKIPPFLRLALERLECKKGVTRRQGTRKRKGE